MSETKRKQGRPTKAEGEVGRAKIIRLVQTLLRSEPQTCTSRKVIAQKIGVTPALITYYFPQKISFLIDVTAPIIDGYASRLRQLTEAHDGGTVELRSVITLLVDLYGRDKRLIEIYREVISEAGVANAVEDMQATLADYLTTRGGGKRPRTFEAAVLQGAVQGMCDFAKRVEKGNSIAEPYARTEEAKWVDQLQAFFSLTCSASSMAA